MILLRPFRLGPLALFLLVLVFLGFPASAAGALAPEDLIVVYNRRVPESREVAEYYAHQRGVPAANLVGVKVTPGESMSRREYDQELVPVVRRQVVEARRGHRNPALVLMYGMPLRVGGVSLTEAEEDLRAQVKKQLQEAASQAWALLKELEALLTRVPGKPSVSGRSPTPEEVFKLADELLPRARRWLKWPSDRPDAERLRAQAAALLAELSGRSPDSALESGKNDQGEREKYEVPRGEKLPEQDNRQPGTGLAAQARQAGARVRKEKGLLGEVAFWQHLEQLYGRRRTEAAVDSELTLLLVENYPRVQWLPNPMNQRFDGKPALQDFRRAMVMVGRVDGPTPGIARRLVDEALEAEKLGLRGTCYLDARGLKGKQRTGSYAWFDAHLVRLARLMQERSTLKVVLDKRPGLFLRGSCPDAALYCGWYSLAQYVPSCTWKRGAVAYHVASAEATTLKRPGSQVWCKRLLEEGVAATLGPVAEPYLQAFPLPDDFFPLLMTGKLSLLEVYFRTVPHLSWQMVLIGDPLYKPFRSNPAWRP